MRGEDVRALQVELAKLDFKDARGRPLPADGDFGAATLSAVQTFQRDQHLAADGVVGPSTFAFIHSAVESLTSPIGLGDAAYLRDSKPTVAMSAYDILKPEPAVSIPFATPPSEQKDAGGPAGQSGDGARDGAILSLQKNLNTLSVRDMMDRALVENGIYDISTRTAVARFQSEQALPITGTADDATLTKIQGQAFLAELQQSDRALTSRKAPAFVETWEANREQVQITPRGDSEIRGPVLPRESVPTPLRLDDPAHPDHEFYQDVRRHVVELDKSLGRAPDHHTDNIASALTVQARADGLARVDHVELSERGDAMRAVQTPSVRAAYQLSVRSTVATAEASTPMELSAAKWPDAVRQFRDHEQARERGQRLAADREQSLSLDDPRNPGSRTHALYNELERRLPESSEARLMQCTAVCHTHRINEHNLAGVHINYDNLTVMFDTHGLMATPAVADLSVPPPEPEHAVQQIQQFDQQMAQIAQQSQERSAQMSQQGPVM
jgi:peptidoglycan hydrolase-like protein with peptidoglycan-binding domain